MLKLISCTVIDSTVVPIVHVQDVLELGIAKDQGAEIGEVVHSEAAKPPRDQTLPGLAKPTLIASDAVSEAIEKITREGELHRCL